MLATYGTETPDRWSAGDGSDTLPALVAGSQVAGQYWYRDQGAAFNTGLTDAVDFTLLP